MMAAKINNKNGITLALHKSRGKKSLQNKEKSAEKSAYFIAWGMTALVFIIAFVSSYSKGSPSVSIKQN